MKAIDAFWKDRIYTWESVSAPPPCGKRRGVRIYRPIDEIAFVFRHITPLAAIALLTGSAALAQENSRPVQLIFDTDIGNDCDEERPRMVVLGSIKPQDDAYSETACAKRNEKRSASLMRKRNRIGLPASELTSGP